MKQLFDTLTNRFTMYRLALYCLVALAIIADILAVFNMVPGDPFALQVSILVLMASCLGVNYVFAYMFGVRPNSESALISAFILFFIFSPPESPAGVVTLVLVGATAMASKYLLAWRGRHIFNPAAVAAVVLGLVGLEQASWWIGTGAMTLPVILLGMLVLYKTRRVKMGLVYAGVSYAVTIALFISKGYDIAQGLPVLVFSWPVLFLMGFMLSEPLTQPPQRYQRYIYAVIVAVLLGAQLQLGVVYVTPEIALIVGNAVAFLYGQHGAVRLKLVGRKQLSRDQVEYVFEPQRKLRQQAGQYMELQIPQAKPDARGRRRMFTIASAPGSDTVKIATRHYQPPSTYKKAFLTLPVGNLVTATGVYGDFILPKDPNEKLLLIAGGIGVTPFRSHLEWLLATEQRRDGVLLYSVRSADDAVFQDILLAQEHGVKTHIITQPIDRAMIEKYAPDIAQRHVFVSGPPGMVDAVSDLAKEMNAKKIRKDHFNGY
jgi:ferredoxin-NADP reductase